MRGGGKPLVSAAPNLVQHSNDINYDIIDLYTSNETESGEICEWTENGNQMAPIKQVLQNDGAQSLLRLPAGPNYCWDPYRSTPLKTLLLYGACRSGPSV